MRLCAVIAVLLLVTGCGPSTRDEVNLAEAIDRGLASAFPSPTPSPTYTSFLDCLDLSQSTEYPDLSSLRPVPAPGQPIPSDQAQAIFEASTEWTTTIAEMVQCRADHGPFPGADFVLAVNGAALSLAHLALEVPQMAAVVNTAMAEIVEHYPESCYQSYAKEYLKTGLIDSTLAEDCH